MYTTLRVTAVALVLAPLPAWAQGCQPRGNATILTVAVDPAQANRPGNLPTDRLATLQEQAFTAGRAYSADMLATLPLEDRTLVLPYDGRRHTFTGPRLEAVLGDAGASGRGVTAQTIDGYQVGFSAAELAALHPVLAICRDGQRLGIGDLGPGFIVYTPGTGERPDDEAFARMAWGVYFLRPL